MAESFQQLYKKLNPAQKKAVDTIEGPVMVIAGPGTGKTQILSLRIANILKQTDTSPDNILALTFTESGVYAMRRRLVEMIGSQGYRVGIFTFHGFCNEIIKTNPDAFPRIIGATNVTDVDSVALMKEVITSAKSDRLRPFGNTYFYVDPVRRKISELKRENISSSDFAAIIEQQQLDYDGIEDLVHEKGKYQGHVKGKYQKQLEQIEKNRELLQLYKAYEILLHERNLYDYDDMIVETIRALETNQGLLLSLQEQYHYLLADEHQDANRSQNRLLELLAQFHDNPNLFIVGDEKQAIFRFQGASLDNFLYFKRLYPDAVIVQLEENYRSTQPILDAAHSLIQAGPTLDENVRVELQSQQSDPAENVHVHAFSRPDFEYLYIAHDITEKIGHGVSPAEIAVLYRNNRDADNIIRVLEKTSIPFAVESDQNVLTDPDIRNLVTILEAVHHFGHDVYLIDLLHVDFLNIEPYSIYELVRYARREQCKVYHVLKQCTTKSAPALEQTARFAELYTLLNRLAKQAHNVPLLDFFDLVVNESGFLSHILTSDHAIEKLEKLNGLFNDARSLVEAHREYTLSDYIDYVQELRENNIRIRREVKKASVQGVRLMTAHRSKGQEFDYVYIIDAHDTHWGNKKTIEYFHIPLKTISSHTFEKNDDERRLFYVAMTRARQEVNILYAKEGDDGKPHLPTQFIEEIDPEHRVEVDTTEFEQSADTTTLLRPARKAPMPPLKDKQFLNELFLEQGLSVTALNNFLKCPWNYFYNNLLRVPRAQNKHLLYGTAIHATLRDLFDRLAQGEDVSETHMIQVFERELNRQPFTEHDHTEARAKGKKALKGYLKQYGKNWNTNTQNEFRISTLLPLEIPNIGRLRLRGDIDKIEFINDRDVNVVDYKTGRPRSRNDIEGKTKSSGGEYKRQLVFYKLLLDLYDEGKFSMITAEIDFIEPDAKGRYHKEQFVVTDEEMAELKKTISDVSQAIIDLSFWDTICNDKQCEYCDLRARLRDTELF